MTVSSGFLSVTSAASTPPPRISNRLLAALPAAVLDSVRPDLTWVRLTAAEVLLEAEGPVEYVHFIESGLVCLLLDGQPKSALFLAMIGREGGLGVLEVVQAGVRALAPVVVQTGGVARRIPVAKLRLAMQAHPALQEAVSLAARMLTRQLMTNAVANAVDTVAERYVRWLVIASIKVGGAEMAVTHAELSTMLGLRRPSVTQAARTLQHSGLIRYRRGRVHLLDRLSLLGTCCALRGRCGACDLPVTNDRTTTSFPLGAAAE